MRPSIRTVTKNLPAAGAAHPKRTPTGEKRPINPIGYKTGALIKVKDDDPTFPTMKKLHSAPAKTATKFGLGKSLKPEEKKRIDIGRKIIVAPTGELKGGAQVKLADIKSAVERTKKSQLTGITFVDTFKVTHFT